MKWIILLPSGIIFLITIAMWVCLGWKWLQYNVHCVENKSLLGKLLESFDSNKKDDNYSGKLLLYSLIFKSTFSMVLVGISLVLIAFSIYLGYDVVNSHSWISLVAYFSTLLFSILIAIISLWILERATARQD